VQEKGASGRDQTWELGRLVRKPETGQTEGFRT
jgi:hypothetical protein